MVRLRSYWVELLLVAILMAAVGFFGLLGYGLIAAQNAESDYSGEAALADAATLMSYGPRIVGTTESVRAQEWLARELQQAGWHPIYQPFYLPAPVDTLPPTATVTTTTPSDISVVIGRNIIGLSTREDDPDLPVAWLVARYDTRLRADADPVAANQLLPVPGANGGASGPATLLELARSMERSTLRYRFCIVLLDGEANQGLDGWTNVTGIDYFLRGLESVEGCQNPEFAVVLDLVGGTDQQLQIEAGSDPALSRSIAAVAAALGYDGLFVAATAGEIPSPHNRLIEEKIPTVTLIDHAYPHRDTTEDTVDKLSADSFTRVGETLSAWLEAGAPTTEE